MVVGNCRHCGTGYVLKFPRPSVQCGECQRRSMCEGRGCYGARICEIVCGEFKEWCISKGIPPFMRGAVAVGSNGDPFALEVQENGAPFGYVPPPPVHSASNRKIKNRDPTPTWMDRCQCGSDKEYATSSYICYQQSRKHYDSFSSQFSLSPQFFFYNGEIRTAVTEDGESRDAFTSTASGERSRRSNRSPAFKLILADKSSRPPWDEASPKRAYSPLASLRRNQARTPSLPAGTSICAVTRYIPDLRAICHCFVRYHMCTPALL